MHRSKCGFHRRSASRMPAFNISTHFSLLLHGNRLIIAIEDAAEIGKWSRTVERHPILDFNVDGDLLPAVKRNTAVLVDGCANPGRSCVNHWISVDNLIHVFIRKILLLLSFTRLARLFTNSLRLNRAVQSTLIATYQQHNQLQCNPIQNHIRFHVIYSSTRLNEWFINTARGDTCSDSKLYFVLFYFVCVCLFFSFVCFVYFAYISPLYSIVF